MAVSDYDPNNQSGGQGPVANGKKNNSDPSKYDQTSKRGQLLQSRWSELSDKQRARFGSKAEYSNMRGDYRRAQEQGANTSYGSRMAGEKIRGLKEQREELRQDKEGNAEQLQKINQRINNQQDKIYGNLENFDASAAGAGGQKGTNRISKTDIHNLVEAMEQKVFKNT